MWSAPAMARSLPKMKTLEPFISVTCISTSRDGTESHARPFSDHGNNAGRSKQLKSKTKVRAYCLIPRKRKRMKTYQHTQTGTTILVCVGLMCLGFAIGSISRHALLLTTVLLATGMWIFRSLTVEISDTELVWHFGLQAGCAKACRSQKSLLPNRYAPLVSEWLGNS